MTQGYENNLVKAIILGFAATDTGVIRAFSLSIEIALTDTVHHELIEKRTRNSFERRTQSKELLNNKFAEGLSKHPSLN